MSLGEEEMQHDGDDDSDSDFEVISVNPNVMYESDEETDEEPESPVKVQVVKILHHVEVKEESVVKVSVNTISEASCDSVTSPIYDDNSMNSNDSGYPAPTKTRKKLNLQEYKIRRANEKPQMPLFDLPKKVAAYELCDMPASLPLLILPTDPHCEIIRTTVKSETGRDIVETRFNPDHYEEIILVSTRCNTEVTIPPHNDSETKTTGNFLTNIVNNLKDCDKAESLLNSSTTLFSSIQAVVQGKCAASTIEHEDVKDKHVHGEDKIIMHLRKDRLRPFKCSIAIQTEDDSLFPPLLLSPALIFNRIRNARNYRRKISRSRSRSRSRSFSPSSEYERVKYHSSNRYSRSQHSTHSSSHSSSSGSESDSSSCSSTQSSADSLKRFNDRNNFRFYNRNQRDQGYTYQEERKIIYIGGLEEETTKDEIRRKFLNYGTIKKISLHSKEDGLRYGFVTFAEASCAYEVIDKFQKDSTINKYDIRFGGRRKFCKQSYADLDSITDRDRLEPRVEPTKSAKELSFEDLLKLAKKEIVGKK